MAIETKRQQDDYRKMIEYQEQQRERGQRQLKATKKSPEAVIQRYATRPRGTCVTCRVGLTRWEGCNNPNCLAPTCISIEPEMACLTQVFRSSTTIRLDEQTHNRLVEFAKPDETYPDLINRLMDIAAAAVAVAAAPTATATN